MTETGPIRAAALAAALLLAPAFARAETVVELFTSQSCSSCPPAEALLGELAGRPGVLALAFHVDYWDRLGWKDPYSSPGHTARQRRYAGLLDDHTVYTPELVVNGAQGVVGSDRGAVSAALAASAAGSAVPVRLSGTGGTLSIEAGPGPGQATIWLAGFDPHHSTHVGGGENGGRVLEETNVVRSFVPVGTWSGGALTLSVPKPPGERAAVLLQRADGRIIGAGSLPAG